MATSLALDDNEEFTCPICLNILQEPFLTECCGQHFCADCIASAKRPVNRCPYCQHEPLNGMIDKHFKRRLKDELKDMNLINRDERGESEQVSSEQQTSEITEQMDISSHSDSEQESNEQQSNELQSSETACDEQGSSNDQKTRDVDVVRDAERRVDNAVQLATTVSGTGLGGVGAALGGVGIGAAIGSVVPGVGTLIGGTIGGIAGGISGVAGGTFIGYGVGKITNRLRKNPTIKNRLGFFRFPRPHT